MIKNLVPLFLDLMAAVLVILGFSGLRPSGGVLFAALFLAVEKKGSGLRN